MNMREKIARALLEAGKKDYPEFSHLSWANASGRIRGLYLNLADAALDAALDALMDPSSEQMEAFAAWVLNKDFEPKLTGIDLYRVMIRAAKDGR